MGIKSGYYIKARCIKDSWIAHAPPVVREVWDYLLREANYTEKTYDGYTVKRGQLFRSYKQIRDDLSWKVGYRVERYHESSMKRAMKALMNERMIELTSEPRGNLITVVNYDHYQDPVNYERTSEQTNEETNSEPRANQCRTPINKKVKKGNNVKKEEPPLIPPGGESVHRKIFNHWNAMHVKVHQKLTDAMKRKINTVMKDYPEQQVIDAISVYAEILHSDEYWWDYKWGLEEFLQRGLKKFDDPVIARNNYRIPTNGDSPSGISDTERKKLQGMYEIC